MITSIVDRGNLRTVYELDSSTGDFKKISNSVVHGVGVIKSKKIVAIFAENKKLYFQIGKSSWDISKHGLTFFNRSLPLSFGVFREFIVIDGSERVLFKTIYLDPYFFHWKNWIDITYDEFDSQMDDIYLWLSKEANDASWKAELLARWTKGISVPSKTS